MRYPDASVGNGPINKNEPVKNGKRNFDKTDNGVFTKGEAFNIDGTWHKYTNDAHGTHVGGTMAASRDAMKCTVWLSALTSILPILVVTTT